MKSFFTFLILLSAVTIFAQQEKQRYDAFSGTIVLTVEGGTAIAHTDYTGIKPYYMGRAMIEYFLPSVTKSSLGFRLHGGTGLLSGEDYDQTPALFSTSLYFGGGGLVYTLALSKTVFPYLFAGLSYLSFDPKDEFSERLPRNKSNVYKRGELNYAGELGFRFLVTENLSLNISGGVQISPNDNLDDKLGNANNDLFFTGLMGLSYSFFSEKDSDLDGVVDSKDACGSTPIGIKVDEFGCPVDTDKDGVADHLDKCPATPIDVNVDEDGCPINSDGDKVPDYLDLCPDTPAGIPVDDFGCPYDLDADGVPDYLDKCPNTEYGVEVDKNGCPLDSDLDGVPDYLDQCPDTEAGKVVDEFGCPKIVEPEPKPVEKKEDIKEFILSSGTNFKFGSTTLLPTAYAELDKLVAVMKASPMSRWRVEGHTDNIGSVEANRKVSLDRAQAVLNYFASKGISRGRFTVSGLGSAYPITSNNTEEGRARNRRVVILKVN